MAANAINLLFNAWLGRVVTPEEFGVIALINTFMYIGGIFYLAFGATALREVGVIDTKENSSAATAFFFSLTKKVLLACALTTIIWILAVPLTANFFNIEDPIIFYLFTPVLLIYPLVGLGKGYLQGRLFFFLTGLVISIEPLIKLISAWILLNLNLESWIYSSIYISAVLTGILAIALVFFKKPAEIKSKEYAFPHKFFWASFLTTASTISFLALDMVLVKHFLSPLEAGQYAFLSLLGKIVYFLGSLLNVFTITLVSRETSKSKNPYISFSSLFGLSALLCGIGILTLGIFGSFFIPLIFGTKALAVIPYALPYVTAISLFTLGSILVTYHLAKKDYLFPIISISMSALLTIGMLVFNKTLTQIVYILLIVGFIHILTLTIAHFYRNRLTPAKITASEIEKNLEEVV